MKESRPWRNRLRQLDEECMEWLESHPEEMKVREGNVDGTLWRVDGISPRTAVFMEYYSEFV